MIQIKSNIERDLKEIAFAHFKGVLPIVINQLSSLSYIPNGIRDYLSPEVIEQIIISEPEELLDIERKFKAHCKSRKITRDNHYAKQIFKYKTFSNKNINSYNAYSLAALLNIRTCPYCNRQFTFTVINTEMNFIRPDFDHFFSQSDHPILALSFYNLIPSCLLCNRTLKHTKKFSTTSHLHPYVDGFGNDAKFNFFPYDHSSAIGQSTNFDIYFEFSDSEPKVSKIKKNIQDFKLDKIYQGHGDYVSEIIRKYYLNNVSYLEALHSTFPSVGSKDELYRLAFGNFYGESSHEKRVLAKLTQDIAEKLGMLEYLKHI